MLVAWPWFAELFAIVVVLVHGVLRRPRASPAAIVVGEDGGCVVPEWWAGRQELDARTRVCPYWINLSFGTGPHRRDLLLVKDQIGRDDWSRLAAVLRRARIQ